MLSIIIALAAAAQAEDAREAQARSYFAIGQGHFNLAEYSSAIEAFQAGYRLKPLPLFLFNIAQAARKSGRLELAQDYYVQYLEHEKQAAPQRAEARLQLGRVRHDLLTARDRHGALPPSKLSATEDDPPATAKTAAAATSATVARVAASRVTASPSAASPSAASRVMASPSAASPSATSRVTPSPSAASPSAASRAAASPSAASRAAASPSAASPSAATSAATLTAAPPAVDLAATLTAPSPTKDAPRPAWQRGWFWGTLGAVVVVGIGAGVGGWLALQSRGPSKPSLGAVNF